MENCISSVDEKNFPSKLFADDIMYKETMVFANTVFLQKKRNPWKKSLKKIFTFSLWWGLETPVPQNLSLMCTNVVLLKKKNLLCNHIALIQFLNTMDTLQMFCLLNSQMNACEPNPKTTSSNFNRLGWGAKSLQPKIPPQERILPQSQLGYIYLVTWNHLQV